MVFSEMCNFGTVGLTAWVQTCQVYQYSQTQYMRKHEKLIWQALEKARLQPLRSRIFKGGNMRKNEIYTLLFTSTQDKTLIIKPANWIRLHHTLFLEHLKARKPPYSQ